MAPKTTCKGNTKDVGERKDGQIEGALNNVQ